MNSNIITVCWNVLMGIFHFICWHSEIYLDLNFLGTNFCVWNRQVFGLYRFSLQKCPKLGLKLGLYRVLFYSGFDLDGFHCNTSSSLLIARFIYIYIFLIDFLFYFAATSRCFSPEYNISCWVRYFSTVSTHHSRYIYCFMEVRTITLYL